MPKQRPIRAATGNQRKAPLRRTQRNQRHQIGLTSRQVDFRSVVQHDILSSDVMQSHLRLSLLHLNKQKDDLASENDEENESDDNAMDIDDEIEDIEAKISQVQNLRDWQAHVEMLHFDVLQENVLPIQFTPSALRSFDDWDDRRARGWTGFLVRDLRRIARMFDMDNGTVRIQNHGTHHYVFERQELFLYASVKAYSGLDNEQLVDCIFGGDGRRWSSGMKWYTKYLDRRYRNILNLVGLDRVKHEIPNFARAIARKINQIKRYICPYTGTEMFFDNAHALVDENFFRIFSFIDGNYFKSNTPGSGPHGDYVGAMRRPNWYIIQRAVYNLYKRLHGQHLLTLMLPNGINYIFGPNPARGGDMSAMMHSQMNLFLEELQRDCFVDVNNQPVFYATHGDLLFNPQSCVTRNHKSAPNAPLTPNQIMENQSLNHVRIAIEHSYGYMQNKFKILRNPNEFRLMQQNSHAPELLRMVMLYSNIAVCVNGMQVGSANFFNCPPPTLEEYLRDPIL